MSRRHRFWAGQTVVAPFEGLHGVIPRGPYLIVRRLPLINGEPRYRVRSVVDGHERALLECQIRLLDERQTKPAVPLGRRSD